MGRPAKWRERLVRVEPSVVVERRRRVVTPGRPGHDLAELRRLRAPAAHARRLPVVVDNIVAPASHRRRAVMRRRGEVARPGRREDRRRRRLAERRGGEGEGRGGRGGRAVVVVVLAVVVVVVQRAGPRLHLQGVLEAHE